LPSRARLASSPAPDFIFGDLFNVLSSEVAAAVGTVPNIESMLGNVGVQPPPLAVQGSSPASGLFGFDKFSSMPLLAEAVREAVAASGLDDSKRRLFLVPLAHVIKLHTSGGVVHTIEVDVEGERKFLAISPQCAVILAASTIESTRLALHSFPTPLMGRNLMAHVRSDFTVRIKRSAWRQKLRFSKLETHASHGFGEDRCERVVCRSRLPHCHREEFVAFSDTSVKHQTEGRGNGRSRAPALLVLVRSHCW
jgi:hypothetical protein